MDAVKVEDEFKRAATDAFLTPLTSPGYSQVLLGLEPIPNIKKI